MDELTPRALKALKANILTEHFGFAPESFAKQGMDLSNVTIYAATEAVERALMEKARLPPVEGEVQLDEEEIQKAIYRMETLLESAIDKHFDLFELFVLRNTFNIPTDLIPYIALSHQENLGEVSKGEDQAALDEYEDELRQYEDELKTARALSGARELVRRKLDKVQAVAEEVGYMRGAEPLSSRTSALVAQITLLESLISTLSLTPAPPLLSAGPTTTAPWGASRAAFLNWAATAKVDALPSSAGAAEGAAGGAGNLAEDEVIRQMAEGMDAAGRQDDAQNLMASLAGP